MNTLNKESKIYVFSPANKATGGVELLHQLVDYLRNGSYDAYIYYYNDISAGIPKEYEMYNIEITKIIEDEYSNIIILPEISFYYIHHYKKLTPFLWWLSIDNYYKGKGKGSVYLSDVYEYDFKFFVKEFFCRIYRSIFQRHKLTKKISLKQISQSGYLNLYQSEYARQYLENIGISNLLPLKDYINTKLSSIPMNGNEREPYVIYNPKKGFEYTKKIIKLAPDITFIPVINLSREELQQLFRKSMLYIDFGNHPGKDRLPREAAINGCCIITGRRGAANNDIDIPIDSRKYKFDEKQVQPSLIVKRIREILTDYDQSTLDFDNYREQIKKEEAEFYSQIDALFEMLCKDAHRAPLQG